jgi:hypothetical protein
VRAKRKILRRDITEKVFYFSRKNCEPALTKKWKNKEPHQKETGEEKYTHYIYT